MNNSNKAISSAILLAGNGIVQKGIGLLSTLVLARVLLPDDFAIVAIATLVIMFIEVFTITGSEQYILSQSRVNKKTLDSAWTLDVIVKSIAAIVALSLAYPLGLIYENSALTPVLFALSAMPLLTGLSNPGLWRLKRQQHYSLVISIQVVAKIVGVIITIVFALSTESYWALIVGQLVTTGGIFLLSYALCKYRPSFTSEHIRKQYSFSTFMIGQELFGYLKSNIDTFFISRSFSNSEFGHFHVMKYIAVIPSLSIMVPIAEPLLVEMSKDNKIKRERQYKYTVSLMALLLVSFPISILMFFHSELFVFILLGKNWVEYHQILGFMGLLVTSFVIANHCKRALIIERKTNLVFIYEICATLLVVWAVVINLDATVIKLVKDRVFVELLAVTLFFVLATLFYLKSEMFTFVKRMLPFSFGLSFLSFAYYHFVQTLQVIISSQVLHLLFSLFAFCLSYILLIILFYFVFYSRTREGEYLVKLSLKLVRR